MAINLKNTRELKNGKLKVLVYGQAGAGKTTLIRTLPSPVVVSAEAGLLPLSGSDIPYIEVKSLADVQEALAWAQSSQEAAQFESIALDSISEIGEVVLAYEMGKTNDPRKAYGEMQVAVTSAIKAFRDLGSLHVYFSSKLEKQQDEMGRVLYYPSMPGNKLAQGIPYHFDEVLALRVERDDSGSIQRALMCDSDGLWLAKDRSGKLDPWEAPDLGAIITKVQS